MNPSANPTPPPCSKKEGFESVPVRCGPVNLRKGWTTGACATAAARAAWQALLSGAFSTPVRIVLPHGLTPEFVLSRTELGTGWARASVIKDAGDDPDITHGAEIVVTVAHGAPGSGILFCAGEGVGIITRPGLPLPEGEAAINPGPRAMIARNLSEFSDSPDVPDVPDVIVTIGVTEGRALARKTLNERLGIVGGLSILGTTGVVIPYSCSAWVASIQRGIDVALASGITHVAGSTGRTSEAAITAMHGLADVALIDMGDFVGPLLAYLRRRQVPRFTIAGGFSKLVKLGQGRMDLHSSRSQVDFDRLAELTRDIGAGSAMIAAVRTMGSAGHVLEMARVEGLDIGRAVALRARETVMASLVGGVAVDVAVFDRSGRLVGHAGP